MRFYFSMQRQFFFFFFINYKHFNTSVESLLGLCVTLVTTQLLEIHNAQDENDLVQKAVLTNSFIISSLVSTGKKNYTNREDDVHTTED